LSVVFDQFTVAILEAAQEESYDFDSSWFPWEDEKSDYVLLADDKVSEGEQGQTRHLFHLVALSRARILDAWRTEL
jgi:hypothetical protein